MLLVFDGCLALFVVRVLLFVVCSSLCVGCCMSLFSRCGCACFLFDVNAVSVVCCLLVVMCCFRVLFVVGVFVVIVVCLLVR